MTTRRKKPLARRGAGGSDVTTAPDQIREPRILGDIVGYALRRAQFSVYQDYARTIGDLDVRPAQFAAMALIDANPGLSQTALAAAMGIDRSGAVTLIDALEERGLAVRMPSRTDRRTYAIMLTAPGQALLSRLIERVVDHDRRMTAALSAEERLQLIGMLRRLYDRT
jgi:DNA-binding MarR family transcriptional regulator